ncbi:hypothetical protein ABPG75_003759 [Micractinium tetrahymenae]
MTAGWPSHRWRTPPLVLLVVALHAAAVARAVSPPGPPTISSLSTLDPFSVPACSQPGTARDTAGCGLLSLKLQPPAQNGGAAISSYSIVCVPQQCTILVRRGRRMLRAASAEVIPSCTPANTMKASGPGSKVKGSSLLLFQLPFPALTGYAFYKCVATAANSKGWGASSSAKYTLLPPSPPSPTPNVVDAGINSAGGLVVTVRKPPANAGINGFVLLARPAGARHASGSDVVRIATGVPSAQQAELQVPREQLQPGTSYQLAVHYAHTAAGAANPLLSMPAARTVRTPDPTNPTVVSVTALDPATTPTCRERNDGYKAAGCYDVVIVVDPPKNAAVRAAITSYTVVCKRCNSARRRSSQRRLLGALDPCTMPPTTSGLGEAMPSGKLKFTMSLTDFNVGTYQCTAVGSTAQGDTDTSPQKPFPVPVSPPTSGWAITSLSMSGTDACVKTTYCSANSDQGITGYLIIAQPADGSGNVVLEVAATPSPGGGGALSGGLPPPSSCKMVSLAGRPNTQFTFSTQTLVVVSPALTLKGALSGSRKLTTPPDAPIITGVAFVEDAGVVDHADITLAAPPNTNPLTYTVKIDGAALDPSAATLSDGANGTKVLSVKPSTPFVAGQTYSFAVSASGDGGSKDSVALSAAAPAALPLNTTP